MKRRDFLKTAGSFIVVASVGNAACGGDDGGGDGGPDATQTGLFAFPQGVASGDPLPTAVMLWTRVEATGGGSDDVVVHLQVATDEAFSTLVSENDFTVTAASDFTLRALVEGLTSNTIYYYRFQAGPGADTSDVGRTWTAPAADADVNVNLAWVSCQDYEAGFHGAYRELIKDDMAAAAAARIHAVVHLGDFIYETRDKQFSAPLNDDFQVVQISDRNGVARRIAPFPDGGDNGGYALTLADYRHQYRQYLQDPDLRAARARWPFIQTWDDHEFTNDAWQTMANYTDPLTGDEPMQRRKAAANQAWFEFVPAVLSDAVGVTGVPNPARDFQSATVNDAPFGTAVDANNLFTEANNVAALGTLTIYRSVRLGRHCELVITDGRSYRSDHPIPEELIYQSSFFFDQRNVLSFEMNNAMDAGSTANGGNPPTSFHSNTFQNTNRTRAPGTMLGGPQKAWWKATMMGSNATWKVWANGVPLMRFFLDNGTGTLIFPRVMNSDAWDGYNHERNELMAHLRTNSIKNVVTITGDIHAAFAGVVMDDHDAATPNPVLVELIAPGVSSNSLFSFFEYPTRTGAAASLRGLVTYDATGMGGTKKFVENINLTLLYGSASSLVMAQTNDFAMATANRDATVNPHLKYADTNAQGYGLLRVTATGTTADIVTVNRPIADSANGPGKKRTAHFTVPLVAGNEAPTLEGPTFTGTPPFPFNPET
jgi:alkaline phosphatase D